MKILPTYNNCVCKHKRKGMRGQALCIKKPINDVKTVCQFEQCVMSCENFNQDGK